MIVRSIDLGYGNVKFCSAGNTDGVVSYGFFPSVAKLHTGIDRGAGVMSSRDLVTVEADGSIFMVGRDAEYTLSARDDRRSHLSANFVDTPQYLALFRGALAYLGDDEIDLMVAGLPVDHFARDKDRLKARLVGTHRFPGRSAVSVKDAWIIPQPAGGFIKYFMEQNDVSDIDGLTSLTIDVGYYTLDWLVCRGLQMQDARCGSTPGGMSLVLERLAELISNDRGVAFENLGMVDEGIRKGFATRIQGKHYDFSHLVPKMEAHIVTAIQSVVRSVGSLNDIDVIVLVGGGAACYRKKIESLLGREVVVPGNSIFSNVQGFFIAGNQRVNGKGA